MIDNQELLIKLANHIGYTVISIQNGKLNVTKDSKKNFHWNPITDDGDMFRLMREFPVKYYINAIQQDNLSMVQEIFKNIKSKS